MSSPADAGPLRPYLTYSFALHVGVGLAAALFLRSQSIKATPIYTIDFVGPTAGIISASQGTAAPSQQAETIKGPERLGREEELRAPSKKRAKLPKPSLLSKNPPPAPEPEARETSEQASKDPAPGEGTQASQAISGAPGSGGVVTDMPNFPYPWYISQIRASLWNQWSSRMPAEDGMAVVVFTIMPDGSLVDIRIEESSGDPNFDLAAMASARDAGPFPPLPTGFDEPFLKVHVTLKSGR